METVKTIHDICSFYFFVIALLYVVSVLAFRNEVFPSVFMTLMRIMDIPMAMVALGYGGSSLMLEIQSQSEEESPFLIIIFATCLLLFGIVVFVNFAFPSQL